MPTLSFHIRPFRASRHPWWLACMIVSLWLGPHAVGQQPLPNMEDAAKSLQEATVTIRVERRTNEVDPNTNQPSDQAVEVQAAEADQLEPNAAAVPESKAAGEVAVFTGVCLGDRLVVAPMLVDPSATIRITRTDGEQCTASPVVIDEFTGLALLKMDRDEIALLAPAEEMPRVGSFVLSAAAWGIERPVVSYGMVGGVDRRLAGTNFPPLLLCDVRTVETSSGSPIVNSGGELVGIVIASSNQTRRGWTYAIPVSHVVRLVRAYQERKVQESAQPSGQQGSSVIVIQHRRPIVGMVLQDDGESIVVQRVSPGGPAERAGIREGDRILGLEGVKVRSVYQVVNRTFHHRPGDIVRFSVEQVDQPKEIALILGGDVSLPVSSLATLDEYVDPKVRIRGMTEFLSHNEDSDLEEIARATWEDSPDLGGVNAENLRPLTPVALLERAIANYQTVIAVQQDWLRREARNREMDRQRIRELEQQLELLREAAKERSTDDRDNAK